MIFSAIPQLQEPYPRKPLADLPLAEAEVLTQGGLDLSPRGAEEESALARTRARYTALLETSLTTAEAAERLGVKRSCIRRRLAKRTLYGIRLPKGWRLPAFQFLEDGSLPGVDAAISRLSPHLHPLAVNNFFMLPNVDLHAAELDEDLSPREWLRAGYSSQAVAKLARRLLG